MSLTKGQITTIDFIFASLVIMVILLTFILTWNFLVNRWNNIDSYNRQYLVGLFAADSLVTGQGVPQSWEIIVNLSNSVTFGLVNEKNVINNQKLGRLTNISLQNYTFFKAQLGAINYEVFINVTNINRSISYYTIGNPPGPLNETVYFERFIYFNGSVSLLKLGVWK